MTGHRRGAAVPSPMRRRGAWLGLFALIFQAVAPLSGMPAMRGVNDLSWGLSPICDIGPAWRTGPASRGEGRGDRDIPPCPICQILQHFGAFIPPANNMETLPVALSIAGGTMADTALPRGRAPSSNRARAPPIPA